jgi:hypothetical protein
LYGQRDSQYRYPWAHARGCTAMRLFRCPDDVRLEEYLYRDLSLWEDSVVRIHLLTCRECRAKLAGLREFDLALKSISIEEPPAGFEDDLLRMVRTWDFDPDPPSFEMLSPHEDSEPLTLSRAYKLRWAVGSLVFVLGSFLQHRYGPLIPGTLGMRTNFLFSLQDLGALWEYFTSGAWWNSIVSVISAVKTDGFASLEILSTALPSQALSVLVFGGIAVVVFFSQHRASKDRGEGIE